MPVPFFDLKLQYQGIRDEIQSVVNEVLENQSFIMGENVQRFEEDVARYCGVRHAIGCASGTDAIFLAFITLDIKPGDEIITTPFSFFSSASPIVRMGAVPVFVDVEEDTFNIDPRKIADAITPRTKAILPVHLFGQMADMDAIRDVASQAGVPVIEDASQAVGAEYKGRRSGNFSDIAAFSLYPTKNLGAMGDAGFLTTNDDNHADALRYLRTHGERKKYTHFEFGINSRLDAVQAAILRVKLRHLDTWTDARIANARYYDEQFTKRGLIQRGLKIPAIPDAGDGHRHVFNQYTVRVENRTSFIQHLTDHGIGYGIHYPQVIYAQPCFENAAFKAFPCPVAEHMARTVVSLPVFPELEREQLDAVIDVTEEFFAQ